MRPAGKLELKRSTTVESAAQPDFMELAVTVFTSGFQVRGALHILGILQTFMNDEQKPTITVYGAEAIGLDTNTQAHMTQPEMIINKRSAQVILFDKTPPANTMALLPRSEPLVMYLDHFALSGKFYMGQDSRLADFADASSQQFLVLAEAKMYPLTPLRAGLTTSGPLAMLHKTAFRMYHKP